MGSLPLLWLPLHKAVGSFHYYDCPCIMQWAAFTAMATPASGSGQPSIIMAAQASSSGQPSTAMATPASSSGQPSTVMVAHASGSGQPSTDIAAPAGGRLGSLLACEIGSLWMGLGRLAKKGQEGSVVKSR